VQGWDGEIERRAKELLYRFMEELGVVKAALYLLSEEGHFELADQYGFGKRDALQVQIRAGDALFDWVRRHRTAPAYVNDRFEERSLTQLMESATSARLMVVPLTLGDRLVGFVDARDKARRAPYEPGDVHRARAIAAALQNLIAESGVYGRPQRAAGAPVPPGLTPATAEPPPAPTPPAAAEGEALDAPLIASLAGSVRRASALPGIAGLAFTVTDGRTVRVLLRAGLHLEPPQREAIAAHQAALLEPQKPGLPPASAWGWSEETSDGEERHAEAIRSAVLLAGPPMWILCSALGPVSSTAPDVVLDLLRNEASLAFELVRYRRATRNLARTLLEPGEMSYPRLRAHSQATSELAQRMATIIGMSAADEELVTVAAYLHDVGLRELDYARLHRLENPSEADRRTFRRHPVVGARIVASAEFPHDLAGTIRHHHERWDGSGYPDRLGGRAIPFAARVIHLAEVYDTLTSQSSYRRPVSREAALTMIRAEAGRQFDPDLVPILEEASQS
jgi:putative nucleotidyltransferase with HDIG domain